MPDLPIVSDDDDKMEAALVEAASVPSLASLIQRGKDQGLIKPLQVYAHPSV